MAPRTFTYTWTQTRLETIQDQFRYFMLYGNIDEESVETVVYGVGEKAVSAVGLYACDSSEKRVIEAELRVDWDLSAQLSLSVPTLGSGMTGWDDEKRQAPEIKVAGRRFAETAAKLQLTTQHWVRFVPAVTENPELHRQWCDSLGLWFGGTVPEWKEPPVELAPESLYDLPEAQISMRRAGGGRLS
jgi:hypothetical protein